MTIIKLGNKKKSYKSIKDAAAVTGIPYITLWMRINKMHWPIAKAVKAGVRSYNRKETLAA
jgi:molybdenum-dependent DNA-binding transcriptional regulator ModE